MFENQKDNFKIMYDWQKIKTCRSENSGDMLSILFGILSNTKQIAHEVNLPLNFIPTQCSDGSGV
jgi:hypothetical protein